MVSELCPFIRGQGVPCWGADVLSVCMSRVGVQTCPRSRRGAVSGCPPHGTGSCGARARPGVAPSQLSPGPPRTRRAELCPPPRGGAATQACRSPPPARRGPAPRAAANSCLPLPGGRGDRAFRWAWPVDPPPRRGRGLRALRAGHAVDAPGLRGRLAAPGRTGPGAGPLRVGGARAGLAAAHGLRHGRQGVQQPHPEEGPVDCEPSGRRLLVARRDSGSGGAAGREGLHPAFRRRAPCVGRGLASSGAGV